MRHFIFFWKKYIIQNKITNIILIELLFGALMNFLKRIRKSQTLDAPNELDTSLIGAAHFIISIDRNGSTGYIRLPDPFLFW